MAGAMAFQLLVWLVPNVIGDATAVAILGLLLGSVYPCTQTIFAKLLPRNVQMTVVGFIASARSSGSAVSPFTTGLLAQAVGTWKQHVITGRLNVTWEPRCTAVCGNSIRWSRHEERIYNSEAIT